MLALPVRGCGCGRGRELLPKDIAIQFLRLAFAGRGGGGMGYLGWKDFPIEGGRVAVERPRWAPLLEPEMALGVTGPQTSEK